MRLTTRALFLVFALVLVFMVGRAQASCSATQNCSYGVASVSCSGNNTCVASANEQGYVQCDNIRTYCPAYCPYSQACMIGPDCYDYCLSIAEGAPFLPACPNRCCVCNI